MKGAVVSIAIALGDGEEFEAQAGGQTWLMAWHGPAALPQGRPEGSSAICVTENGEILIVSEDGVIWDLPGGRPEGAESWEETLRREVREEACATVGAARLLGFARARCVAGSEEGLVLVRSFWRANVALEPWAPRFEMTHRRLVTANDLLQYLPAEFGPIFRRALAAATV